LLKPVSPLTRDAGAQPAGDFSLLALQQSKAAEDELAAAAAGDDLLGGALAVATPALVSANGEDPSSAIARLQAMIDENRAKMEAHQAEMRAAQEHFERHHSVITSGNIMTFSPILMGSNHKSFAHTPASNMLLPHSHSAGGSSFSFHMQPIGSSGGLGLGMGMGIGSASGAGAFGSPMLLDPTSALTSLDALSATPMHKPVVIGPASVSSTLASAVAAPAPAAGAHHRRGSTSTSGLSLSDAAAAMSITNTTSIVRGGDTIMPLSARIGSLPPLTPAHPVLGLEVDVGPPDIPSPVPATTTTASVVAEVSPQKKPTLKARDSAAAAAAVAGVVSPSSASTTSATAGVAALNFSAGGGQNKPVLARSNSRVALARREAVSPTRAATAASKASQQGQQAQVSPSNATKSLQSASAATSSSTTPKLPTRKVRATAAAATGAAGAGVVSPVSPSNAEKGDAASSTGGSATAPRVMYAGKLMACVSCHNVKSSCEAKRPCSRCVRMNRECVQREKPLTKAQLMRNQALAIAAANGAPAATTDSTSATAAAPTAAPASETTTAAASTAGPAPTAAVNGSSASSVATSGATSPRAALESSDAAVSARSTSRSASGVALGSSTSGLPSASPTPTPRREGEIKQKMKELRAAVKAGLSATTTAAEAAAITGGKLRGSHAPVAMLVAGSPVPSPDWKRGKTSHDSSSASTTRSDGPGNGGHQQIHISAITNGSNATLSASGSEASTASNTSRAGVVSGQQAAVALPMLGGVGCGAPSVDANTGRPVSATRAHLLQHQQQQQQQQNRRFPSSTAAVVVPPLPIGNNRVAQQQQQMDAPVAAVVPATSSSSALVALGANGAVAANGAEEGVFVAQLQEQLARQQELLAFQQMQIDQQQQQLFVQHQMHMHQIQAQFLTQQQQHQLLHPGSSLSPTAAVGGSGASHASSSSLERLGGMPMQTGNMLPLPSLMPGLGLNPVPVLSIPSASALARGSSSASSMSAVSSSTNLAAQYAMHNLGGSGSSLAPLVGRAMPAMHPSMQHQQHGGSSFPFPASASGSLTSAQAAARLDALSSSLSAASRSFSSAALANHLLLGSLTKVASALARGELSAQAGQVFLAELAGHLTPEHQRDLLERTRADLASMVANGVARGAGASKEVQTLNTASRVLEPMQQSLAMLASASPSYYRGALADDMDLPQVAQKHFAAIEHEAWLVVTRLDGSPVQSPRERAAQAAQEASRGQLLSRSSQAGAAVAPLAKSPDRLCFSVALSAGFTSVFGLGAEETTSLFSLHGGKAPLLLLVREDYIAPIHLLQGQCMLEGIQELEYYAVMRCTAAGARGGVLSPVTPRRGSLKPVGADSSDAGKLGGLNDAFVVVHVSQSTEHDSVDHAPRRLRTQFRPMPQAPIPPRGAHVNILALWQP